MIPFNRPFISGRELRYIAEAIDNGQASSGGVFTRRCEELLRHSLGAKSVLLTTSGTHALEVAALLVGMRPGDEVLIPSYTFATTASAFVRAGGRPVFMDIRPDTLNFDERLLEEMITARTRAIVPVHYAGVACEMDRILEVAAANSIVVVEDNAHGLFARYRGRPLGTIGDIGTLSFHETKNFTCGEGGAVILNDSKLVRRAEVLLDKGTDRAAFDRGEVEKYTWVEVGSSYRPAELLAAYLYAQLQERARIQGARRAIWERYRAALGPWAERNGVGTPYSPAQCEHPFHMFYLVLPRAEQRPSLIAHLAGRNILAVFHFVPLHASPMGRAWGGRPGDCPVAESVSERLVRLPFYTGMTEGEQDRVIDAVTSFRVHDR